MRTIKTILVLTVFLLLGAQCTRSPQSSPEQRVVTIGGAWKNVHEHIRRMEYFFAQDENAKIIMYEFDPSFFSFRFETSDSPATIAEWNEQLQQPLMVVNGVYFHDDYSPSGFLRANNKRIGHRTFDPNRSGLIILSPFVAIEDVDAQKLQQPTFSDAAQTYPFLIKNGAAAVTEESGNVDRRTFIGTSADGHVYVGIIPRTSVSLYELARLLAQFEMTWNAVLNLDGGTSSGLTTKIGSFEEIIPNYTAIPNVIVIEEKI